MIVIKIQNMNLNSDVTLLIKQNRISNKYPSLFCQIEKKIYLLLVKKNKQF